MSDPKPRSGLAGAIIPLAAALTLGIGGSYLLFGRPPQRGPAELEAPPAGTKAGLKLCNVGGTIGVVDSTGTFTALT